MLGTEHGDEGRGSGPIPPGPPGGGFMGRNWTGQSSGGRRPERDRDLMMDGMHIDPPMDPMMLPMSGMMDVGDAPPPPLSSLPPPSPWRAISPSPPESGSATPRGHPGDEGIVVHAECEV